MTDRGKRKGRGGFGLPVLRLLHGVLAVGFIVNAGFVDEDSLTHARLGMFLAGVIALWVALDLARLVPSSFRSLSDLPRALLDQAERVATGRGASRSGLSPLMRAMSWNLLLSFSVICLTGWAMTTPAFWASGAMEDLHEFAVFWTGFSVLGHLALVFWARALRAVSLKPETTDRGKP